MDDSSGPATPCRAVGYARLLDLALDPDFREGLHAVVGPREEWACLLVLDDDDCRWSLLSPDPDFVALYWRRAHELEPLAPEVQSEKFPMRRRGWCLE